LNLQTEITNFLGLILLTKEYLKFGETAFYSNLLLTKLKNFTIFYLLLEKMGVDLIDLFHNS